METPLVIGEISKPSHPDIFSAYFYPAAKPRINRCIVLDHTFEETCVNLADLVDEGYNILRVEASEITAFLAIDCDHIIQPGIIPHIPLAYGLRGPSLSMKTMHAMVNDICTELHERNTSVLCEVYDVQFHDIIVCDQHNNPLTRLQLGRKLFADCMDTFDKSELVDILLPYSQIAADDLNSIMNSTFQHEKMLELDSVTLSMRQRLVHDKHDYFVRSMFIETNAVGDFKMENIVTNHRLNIWNKYIQKTSKTTDRVSSKITSELSEKEITELIRGTKLHRHLTHQVNIDELCEESDQDADDLDENYVPLI